MKKLTFVGIDADLETSLCEYGCIVSNEEHEDGSGTRFVIYKQGEGFECGHISEKQIDGYVLGTEFPDAKDIEGFLSFVGWDSDQWIKLPMQNKLTDLLSYWGAINIMGADFAPMSLEEVIENWNLNL